MQSKRFVLLAAMMAMVIKLWIASSTIGSTDVMLFTHFGKKINRDGLAHTYQTTPLFNHTPLVGTWVAGLVAACDDKAENVALPLRVPGILADLLAVLVLLRLREKTGRPPTWALVLFALSPVSMMVSGYHGNVDSVLALLLLIGAWMCIEGRPALCGLALGLACQVKVVPLLLVPVFAAYWLSRRKLPQFALTGSLATLAGWAPALLLAPHAFVTHVLTYSGYWGIWGISYALRETGLLAYQGIGMSASQATQAAVIIMVTKYSIIAATLALAWQRRKEDVFLTLSGVWAVFFVFATGVAPQYFVWLAPFVLMASPRWYAGLTAASSLFLFAFYNTISHGLPWNVGISMNKHIATWGPWSLLPWMTLIGFLAWSALRVWRKPVVPVVESEPEVQRPLPLAA